MQATGYSDDPESSSLRTHYAPYYQGSGLLTFMRCVTFDPPGPTLLDFNDEVL